MAKRSRGSTSRPGRRRASQRRGPRPAGSVPPASASSTPPAVAAPDADTTTAAPAAVAPATKAVPRSRIRPGAVASDAFVAEVTAEYRYVVADVRRIVVVAAGMFGVMAVLFVLIDLTGVIHL